jgi:tricorn protease-like protein
MPLVFQYRLVSHVPGSTTTTGNAFSGGASFSPDGRWVLVDSLASKLAGSDSNGSSDLFVYDNQDFSVDLVTHVGGSTTTAANAATDAAGAIFSRVAVMCSSTAPPRILPGAAAMVAAISSSTTRRTAASIW